MGAGRDFSTIGRVTLSRYFCLGGYLSKDFLTMSSSLPSILVGLLFSLLFGSLFRNYSENFYAMLS